MTPRETQSSTIALLDAHVGIGLILLRAAGPRERLLTVAMTATAAIAAAPLPVEAYAVAAVPALLGLAAVIRHHADGLDARREALTSAGARPGDLAVIQATAPMAATAAGAVIGMAAALATARPWAVFYAPLPLAVAAVATFLLRPKVVGAFALAIGAAAGLLAAGAAALTSPGGAAALVADARAAIPGSAAAVHPAESPAVWHLGLTALVVGTAVLVASELSARILSTKGDRA